MFDHLNWWQILVVLAPLVAIMQLIKYREQRAGETVPSQLTQDQKGWILLMLLPPGLAARLLKKLTPDEQTRFVEAGSLLKGGGRPAAEAVLKEFYNNLPARHKRGESPDMLEKLALALEGDSQLGLEMLRTGKPLIHVGASPAVTPAQEPV